MRYTGMFLGCSAASKQTNKQTNKQTKNRKEQKKHFFCVNLNFFVSGMPLWLQ